MTSAKETFEEITAESALPYADTADSCSSAKQASQELIDMLSDSDMADDFVVARAERAFDRYASPPPVMSEQDLRNIMQTEKARGIMPFALLLRG